MSTPFEDRLAAALRARFGAGEAPRRATDLRLDQLTVDLPAGAGAVDHGELADAIATALDDLLRGET